MRLLRGLPVSGIAITAGLLFVPAVAEPQVPFRDRGQAEPNRPGFAMSVAAGPMQSEGRQVTMGVGAVQIVMRRHFAVEPELARWVEGDAPGLQALDSAVYETRRRAVTIAGGNLLFRAGTGRVAGFVGGGAGLHFIHDLFDSPVNPSTGAPIGGPGVATSETRLGLQAVGGVEVPVAPRLHAFAAIRGEVRPELNVGVVAGARLVLRDVGEGPAEGGGPRAASGTPVSVGVQTALGRTVEVVRLDGQRVSGRLLALSLDEVAIARPAGELRLRLADVRRVQRPAHWARNLALAGAAVFGGLALGHCTAGSCGGEGLAALAIMGGVATGGGAAIGAMINSATARSRTVYP
jgi:hypothetical protein